MKDSAMRGASGSNRRIATPGKLFLGDARPRLVRREFPSETTGCLDSANSPREDLMITFRISFSSQAGFGSPPLTENVDGPFSFL
jgi:hypothetical protein